MSYINFSINGVAMPAPVSAEEGFNPITEAERNLEGYMIIDGVISKLKYTLRWDYLSAADFKKIYDNTMVVFNTTKQMSFAVVITEFPGTAYSRSISFEAYFAPYAKSLNRASAVRGGYSDITLALIER